MVYPAATSRSLSGISVIQAAGRSSRPSPKAGSFLTLLSWASYDFATSAFAAIIVTFVFPAYFADVLAPAVRIGTSEATAMWGYTHSAAALCVALIAPFAGAAVDRHGRSKLWIARMTALAALASAALWWAVPGSDPIGVLILVALAVVAIELAGVFYNAQLFSLSRLSNIGRISGMSWGWGYAGGLLCLILALGVFVDSSIFDPAGYAGVRATGPLVALWLIVFTLPLLLWVPERAPVAAGRVWTWCARFRDARRRRILRFLCARLLYADALVTLFAFGGIYGTGTFGLSIREVLLLAIGLNIGAGIGAAAFSFLDDAIGSIRLIRICLAAMIGLGSALLVVSDSRLFALFALLLSLFIGPLQAASRSWMARVNRAEYQASGFGLFALAGKVTAFVGPALVAVLTDTFDSQRIGMGVIVVFLAGGWLILRPLKA